MKKGGCFTAIATTSSLNKRDLLVVYLQTIVGRVFAVSGETNFLLKFLLILH